MSVPQRCSYPEGPIYTDEMDTELRVLQSGEIRYRAVTGEKFPSRSAPHSNYYYYHHERENRKDGRKKEIETVRDDEGEA